MPAGGAESGNYWFNPNSFSNAREVALSQALVNGANPAVLSRQFTYGTLGRNILRGPGAFNVNITLSKHFVVKEGYDLEFRVDAFNLLDAAEFSNPDTNIGDPSFGQISNRLLKKALTG